MLENIRVISRGRVAQLGEHLPGQQRVKAKSDSSYSFQFNEMARPGRLELPTLCLEGRRSIQLSYGRILGYSFDSTKVAKPIRHPILPKSWSNLEQLERVEQ